MQLLASTPDLERALLVDGLFDLESFAHRGGQSLPLDIEKYFLALRHGIDRAPQLLNSRFQRGAFTAGGESFGEIQFQFVRCVFVHSQQNRSARNLAGNPLSFSASMGPCRRDSTTSETGCLFRLTGLSTPTKWSSSPAGCTSQICALEQCWDACPLLPDGCIASSLRMDLSQPDRHSTADNTSSARIDEQE